ncbi:eukaryotic translation initiation factor 4 gamma 2 [Phlebotomus argentipes]|uniref:eukaryotic translation initiation factor 4 gamma 2 n=1 Tax=Phlebotomus argentipes TaxID=94469 RepID=UPI002892DD85|nr:eukaryotic translation initiation factor 4 gamma 2 [Phlebotomus argentipes]
MYAQLCKRLHSEAPNFEEPNDECTVFRLIVNTCRDRFIKRSTYSELIKKNDSPLLPEDEEEKQQIFKQKMLGNVKFIGELYKLGMVSESTIHQCIIQLLEPNANNHMRNEDMECLCQLLRTCGKNLDTEQGQVLMNQYFQGMAKKSMSAKYPPRIRFMLRDIIELRRNNWIPRKVATTEGPVPIHQLRIEEDLIRPNFGNRPRDLRNDRDGDWINRHSGFSDMFSNLSNTSAIISAYNVTPGNAFGGRDGVRGLVNGGGLSVGPSGNGIGASGGSYRNVQRNQNNASHQNYQNYNNRYNKHNHGNNNSHNTSFASNMLNNKDLAPRFKRNLIQTPQDPVENLQMRPAANSLLFKANINVNKQQLPLTQPRANAAAANHVGHHGNYMGPMEANPPLPQVHREPQGKVVLQSVAPVNPVIIKEELVMGGGMMKEEVKKAPKQKKDKAPNKEEFIKKVTVFMAETYMPQLGDTDGGDIDEIAGKFVELKVPEKFMKDAVTILFTEILEKSDDAHERSIDFLVVLKKEGKLNPNATVEAFKYLVNTMSERESSIPRVTTIVASLLSRAAMSKLCSLADIASFTENGQHYPLLLLVLQQLHKTLGRQALTEMFNKSKVDIMMSLPDADRTKDRMAEILDDRNLSFLYPLLKVQSELWKQIQLDPNPQQFYKWIKENVDASCYADAGFIQAMMTVLLKYITQETTMAEGIDASKHPEKALIEKERKYLEKYCPILNAFLKSPNLQLVSIYALQVYCYTLDFPKGMLLRWFTALYDLGVIEEDPFLQWKEDITDAYPGKGKALFQVNSWLTWLQEAESEDEENEQ